MIVVALIILAVAWSIWKITRPRPRRRPMFCTRRDRWTIRRPTGVRGLIRKSGRWRSRFGKTFTLPR